MSHTVVSRCHSQDASRSGKAQSCCLAARCKLSVYNVFCFFCLLFREVASYNQAMALQAVVEELKRANREESRRVVELAGATGRRAVARRLAGDAAPAIGAAREPSHVLEDPRAGSSAQWSLGCVAYLVQAKRKALSEKAVGEVYLKEGISWLDACAANGKSSYAGTAWSSHVRN